MQEGAKINIYDPKVSREQIFMDLSEPGVHSNEEEGMLGYQ
jgi:UDPglucose 6-dehydrogenase